MNAVEHIVQEFNRLVAIGREGVAKLPRAYQVVFYIVATRCEIDIDGFSSVYEQDLGPVELEILITGLQQIEESELAAEFKHGYKLLQADGFYSHMNWNNVSSKVKVEIDAIGKRIDQNLWGLDDKLSALLHKEPLDSIK